jgi:dihydrofolate synthase/folylpolyglutamate synthase
MTVAILRAAGYQVGAYTSPHIERFNERIQINGECVSDQQIVDVFVDIEAARDSVKLTYFEFSTLAALAIFKALPLDVVVLEVGLGGRLDAVNLVDADAALITAIDIDHVDWLGSDRSVIAIEKAGIMRPHSIAVCSDPQPPASLAHYAQTLGVNLMQLNQDFAYQINDQAWSFNGLNFKSLTLPLPALKGAFQLANAAGVVALLQQLNAVLPVSDAAMAQGLLAVQHPGRLQSLQIDQSHWLIDVAHNPQSAQALADFLSDQAWSKNVKTPSTVSRVAIFSVLADKDALPMIKVMMPHIDTWLIADLSIPRASSVKALSELLISAGVASVNIIECSSINTAVKTLIESHAPEVLVWGSFFTVSQTSSALKGLGKLNG